MKPYHRTDFIRIRDFLISTYAHFGKPLNWTIERWNFSISVARTMNGVSLEEWESQVAIWEQDQEIIGVVNAEGERDGEAFFQLSDTHLSLSILTEMFDFCESNLGKMENGKRTIYLHIPPEFTNAQEIAVDRHYTKLSATSPLSVYTLEQDLCVNLPDGFSFAFGDNVGAFKKGQAHAQAFGYFNEKLYLERSYIAFQQMMETPDYRADLDIHVLSPSNEVAAFATLWYDQYNRIANLEPVGTIPKYRKMGLGRACIEQLATKIKQEGATKIYVGSNQDFYLKVGFQAAVQYHIWMKELSE
jgi:GNAT superfamily N-acetyltransferase